MGVSSVINGDVETLYKEHGHYVYQRCRAMLGDEDEAYDALQEVFVKVIRARPSFDDDRPILAWVNRVTTNHCLNRIRARRYRRHLPLDELRNVPDVSSTQFLHAISENRDLLRRLLSAADARTQTVVVGYFFDEHGVDRIGAELGISVPTVRRVLKRFLTASRKKIVAERRRVMSDGAEV